MKSLPYSESILHHCHNRECEKKILRSLLKKCLYFQRSFQLGQLLLGKGMCEDPCKPLWTHPYFEVHVRPFTISKQFEVLEWCFLTTPCYEWRKLPWSFVQNLVNCRSKGCRSREWEDIMEVFFNKNLIWNKFSNVLFHLLNVSEHVLVGHEFWTFQASFNKTRSSIPIV